MHLSLDDFDYDLPPQLIAQAPLAERSASRLLHLDGGILADRRFADLAALLRPGDLLVTNDSRVMNARLFGVKDSGGRVEVLVERVIGAHELLAQVSASKPPRAGSRLRLEDAIEVEVLGREAEFYRLRIDDPRAATELLQCHGRLPLPPYIDRPAEKADEQRYQTVFARHHGSVAAPTAGLHFDEAVLAALRGRGCEMASVTLHVGAGTFQPVRVQDLAQHRMHSERYSLSPQTVAAIAAARARGGRVVAVGTTSLRALESAAKLGEMQGELRAGEGETELFILPGFRFRAVDALITNFHLPRSTLLMLVSAFAGIDATRRAYRHAVEHGYRFFSYGDAMLIDGSSHEI